MSGKATAEQLVPRLSPGPTPEDELVVGLVGDGSLDVDVLRRLLRRDGLLARAVTDVDRPPPPHVAVVAFHRPDVEMAAVVRRVRGRGSIPVVVTSVAGQDVRDLLDAGAMAIVERAAAADVLGPAIRLALADHLCLPAGGLTALQPPALSYRERQVLALMLDGLTNRQIAARLFLSESTVKGHMTAAFRRLNARSRREVTRIISGDDALRRFVVSALTPSTEGEGGNGGGAA
jgi:DNA-binding NarL/FixJ family response regulator